MNKHFELGQVVMTKQINDLIADDANFSRFALDSLRRYTACDWGELCEEDKAMNDSAIGEDVDRILAAYDNGKWKIWIITESDRSATTILFPDEY